MIRSRIVSTFITAALLASVLVVPGTASAKQAFSVKRTWRTPVAVPAAMSKQAEAFAARQTKMRADFEAGLTAAKPKNAEMIAAAQRAAAAAANGRQTATAQTNVGATKYTPPTSITLVAGETLPVLDSNLDSYSWTCSAGECMQIGTKGTTFGLYRVTATAAPTLVSTIGIDYGYLLTHVGDTVIVSGYSYNATTEVTTAFLRVSKNNGTTWTTIDLGGWEPGWPAMVCPTSSNCLMGVEKYDAGTDSYLYGVVKTADGGLTWSDFTVAGAPADVEYGNFLCSATACFITGYSPISDVGVAYAGTSSFTGWTAVDQQGAFMTLLYDYEQQMVCDTSGCAFVKMSYYDVDGYRIDPRVEINATRDFKSVLARPTLVATGLADAAYYGYDSPDTTCSPLLCALSYKSYNENYDQTGFAVRAAGAMGAWSLDTADRGLARNYNSDLWNPYNFACGTTFCIVGGQSKMGRLTAPRTASSSVKGLVYTAPGADAMDCASGICLSANSFLEVGLRSSDGWLTATQMSIPAAAKMAGAGKAACPTATSCFRVFYTNNGPYRGTVYSSSNMLTWTKVSSTGYIGMNDTADCAGNYCSYMLSAGRTLRTSDAGLTWSLSGASPADYTTTYPICMGLVCMGTNYDPDTDENVLLRSADGGTTWSELALAYPIGTNLDYDHGIALMGCNPKMLSCFVDSYGYNSESYLTTHYIVKGTGAATVVAAPAGYTDLYPAKCVAAGTSGTCLRVGYDTAGDGAYRLLRSVNNGTAWASVTSGLPAAVRGSVYGLVIRASGAQFLANEYYGTAPRIYGSADGLTWTLRPGSRAE